MLAQRADVFQKRDILAAARQQIDERIQYFKNPDRRYFMIVLDHRGFDHYDFDAKSFRVMVNGLDTGEYMSTDQSGYKLDFTNGTKYLNLPVTDENRARELEEHAIIGKAGIYDKGPGTANIYLFVQAADHDDTMIHCQVVRIIFKDAENNIVAEF
jgi:hypothetical protein